MSFWGKSNAQAAAELAAGIQEVKTVKNMRKNIFALKDRLANSAEFSQVFYTLIQDVSRPPKLMSCTTVGTIASEEWRPAENNYEPFSTIKIENPNYKRPYRDFVKMMMRNSREYQQTLLSNDVIAYCGVKGAFGHLATERLFPGSPTIHFKSFDEVFQAVVNRKAHYGVIPFENSNSGLVGEVLDGLRKYPVYIQKMADQQIEQCLLGMPEATLKDIEYVYSKDQALAQSKRFLQQLSVQTIAYPNTAMAAQYVANENDIHKAAIGAKENADLYGLKILAEHIEENSQNTTRFLVIGLEPAKTGNRFSIIFETQHISGSLAKIIEIIAKHHLNMDSIQSRPRKNEPFEYFFYIEILDEMLDSDNVKEALREIKEVCESFKVLGMYPVEGIEEEKK